MEATAGCIVEASRDVDVRWLQRQGWLHPGTATSISWTDNRTGETVASIGVRTSPDKVVFSYRYSRQGQEWEDVEDPIAVTWTPCNYGGQRPWFICPGCISRVAILYAGGPHFLCRHCYKLTYASQRETWTDRAMRRARRIRQRFDGSLSLLEPFPPKPKWIRWRTYWRLRKVSEAANLDSWLVMRRQFGRAS